MEKLYYDLHMHSCLSPCGDNEMTPNNLAGMAALCGMQLIALTDHNSCRNCPAALAAGEKLGLLVVPGMELCTAEEIHVVCLFERLEGALSFGELVKSRSLHIPNRPDIFGDQLILDGEDNVVGREEELLISATNIGLTEAPALVRSFGGACFPAHVDRDAYSVLSVLGEFPPEADFRAAEYTEQADLPALLRTHPRLSSMLLLADSDAHRLESVPEHSGWIALPERSRECLIAALNGAAECSVGEGETVVSVL